MRNWDASEETGTCQADQDFKDVVDVCKYVVLRFCVGLFLRQSVHI
jgi:hypothetical protein